MHAGGRGRTNRDEGPAEQLVTRYLPLATDQKVGGSSPSERAQVRGPLPDPEGAFLLLLGATLGATGTNQMPNRARLIDSAAARLSPSSRCPYTSLVMAMLACPRTSETTCRGGP